MKTDLSNEAAKPAQLKIENRVTQGSTQAESSKLLKRLDPKEYESCPQINLSPSTSVKKVSFAASRIDDITEDDCNESLSFTSEVDKE